MKIQDARRIVRELLDQADPEGEEITKRDLEAIREVFEIMESLEWDVGYYSMRGCNCE